MKPEFVCTTTRTDLLKVKNILVNSVYTTKEYTILHHLSHSQCRHKQKQLSIRISRLQF